ncbi:TPA: DUF551 domain-containing protein [Klebsiella pneumoniae]|nr:DUF551 domain-containing protein [Klebsiella pneumoniae]HCQ8689263.1 DUF551 domain-containing protein [Klebsiella pneumoniae]
MNKSTITRERVVALIAEHSYDSALVDALEHLLAAMDSEPVAEVLSNRSGNDTSTFDRALPVGTQLYRHAQQPVVPEEATPDSIEILASGRCRDHVVYQWDEDQRNAAADSWNACRAAMLEADPQLPGSDSAPVPGSWIPVSERMPERGDYLVTDGCDFDVQLFNGEQFIPGFVWEDKITHWMPLPAAPKEVK